MARTVAFLLLLVIGLVYGKKLVVTATQSAPGHEQNCGPNEVFNSCGSQCVDTCEKPAPPVCTLECVIGCECKSGYVRNKLNQCVLTKDC
ncbi:PREDICTED: chymotrypsin inhibitor-like isoform X1 [Eufriesea mexicana]|uniref:chymotrypsin inhibitor-like isoform X1 n=1 Tax=Eufriesea mexicana TaxID=516756 RepID=UPI00083BDB2A|nr:PREDICTED: chymotrypsin inhibitor-like isoform X1 [Eufriesea mexicana]